MEEQHFEAFLTAASPQPQWNLKCHIYAGDLHVELFDKGPLETGTEKWSLCNNCKRDKETKAAGPCLVTAVEA